MNLKKNFFFIPIILLISGILFAQETKPEKPSTNIEDALKYERTDNSMPGKYPAKVVKVWHENSILENKIIYDAVYNMISNGMLQLTGELSLKDAWLKFVDVNDRIGLKVNPVAGPTLTTSVEVTQAIIDQLEEAGVPRSNIIIWDRREEQLKEAGFTSEAFPGIKIIGTERLGENGTMYDENGKLYSERMIDSTWYYWADVEGEYDDETLPYMVNEGKYSYFTKILTEMVDKVINVPLLKNAGASITLCLKNLAYGSITNTGRLHKQLWSDTIADVCAFPPLRDKVVLNIVDGIKGCFNGGPGANPQFFYNYKTILIGTDPVAVDRIGFEIITKKRIKEGLQEKASERGQEFLYMAEKHNLGEADLKEIDLEKIQLK
ncbi:DUF362 domain-containing protein [Bacteroidota bacterium]